MPIFKWLAVGSSVLGVLISLRAFYLAVFVASVHFTSCHDQDPCSSGSFLAIQSPRYAPAMIAFLVANALGYGIALLSAIMYSRNQKRHWRIALWITAVILALYDFLGIFSLGREFLLAALLILLAALFSLGVRSPDAA